MNDCSLELVLSFEGWHVHLAVHPTADHDSVEQLRRSVARVLDVPCRDGPTSLTVSLMLFNRHHFRLKLDELIELEMVGVHAEILQVFAVVQIVGEIPGHRKVAVTTDLL